LIEIDRTLNSQNRHSTTQNINNVAQTKTAKGRSPKQEDGLGCPSVDADVFATTYSEGQPPKNNAFADNVRLQRHQNTAVQLS